MRTELLGNEFVCIDWMVRVSNPKSARDFIFSKNVQAGSGVHPASSTMGTGVLSRG